MFPRKLASGKVVFYYQCEEVKTYKNTCANTVFGTFYLMLNEAVNRGIIKTNPAAVKKLKMEPINAPA